jgi:hypothetical protein
VSDRIAGGEGGTKARQGFAVALTLFLGRWGLRWAWELAKGDAPRALPKLPRSEARIGRLPERGWKHKLTACCLS